MLAIPFFVRSPLDGAMRDFNFHNTYNGGIT